MALAEQLVRALRRVSSGERDREPPTLRHAFPSDGDDRLGSCLAERLEVAERTYMSPTSRHPPSIPDCLFPIRPLLSVALHELLRLFRSPHSRGVERDRKRVVENRGEQPPRGLDLIRVNEQRLVAFHHVEQECLVCLGQFLEPLLVEEVERQSLELERLARR